VRLPARRPRRVASANPEDEVRRCRRSSIARPVTPPPRRVRRRRGGDPCGGARRGSRDRPACASAVGSRAPCAGDGCSADTCACSRDSPVADFAGCADVDHEGGAGADGPGAGCPTVPVAPPRTAPGTRHRPTPVRPGYGTWPVRRGQTDSLWTAACPSRHRLVSVPRVLGIPHGARSSINGPVCAGRRILGGTTDSRSRNRPDDLRFRRQTGSRRAPTSGPLGHSPSDVHNLWTNVWTRSGTVAPRRGPQLPLWRERGETRGQP
jgi:hypothetical protein